MIKKYLFTAFFFMLLNGCNKNNASCDILIENGMIYDGSGEKP